MVSDQHISKRTERDALRKFKHKVEELEKMLEAPNHPLGPPSLKHRRFIFWESPQLGVERISPAHFYSKKEQHTALRERAVLALTSLASLRASPSEKASKIATLRVQLKQSQRGLKYADSELVVARSKIEKLSHELKVARQRLKRQHVAKASSKVVPFPGSRQGSSEQR